MKTAFRFSFLVLFAGSLSAQDLPAPKLFVGDISSYPKNMVTYDVDANGDTVPQIMNYTCVVTANMTFSSKREQEKWNRFKQDVKTAYPYAILAKMKLAEMDSQLVYIHGEEARKAFAKKAEKELVGQFEGDMRNLTFPQGRILLKLIDRETGSTTYQLIKEYRGSFSATMWQGVAWVFGNNLNSDYDGAGEDANIEHVVDLIEMGVI